MLCPTSSFLFLFWLQINSTITLSYWSIAEHHYLQHLLTGRFTKKILTCNLKTIFFYKVLLVLLQGPQYTLLTDLLILANLEASPNILIHSSWKLLIGILIKLVFGLVLSVNMHWCCIGLDILIKLLIWINLLKFGWTISTLYTRPHNRILYSARSDWTCYWDAILKSRLLSLSRCHTHK